MSRQVSTPQDDVLDAVREDDIASLIIQLRERGQVDDQEDWLGLE